LTPGNHTISVLQCSSASGRSGYGFIPRDAGFDPDTQERLVAYREHLRLLNRSERTILTHISRLCTFFSFTRSQGITACCKITRSTILAYREHLLTGITHRHPRHGASVHNQYLAVVISFFRYLAFRDITACNPTTGIRYARESKPLPKPPLSRPAMRAILGQPVIDTILGLRDRAILEVLYSCGLRKSELIALTTDALNLEEGWVSVWAGKGNKDRVVPIGRMARLFVKQYLTLARPRLAVTAPSIRNLFLSSKGCPFSKNALLLIIQKYAARAGLGAQQITPHSFRHAFATHLIQNGASLRHVQEMLGHSKISSTQIYIHLTIKDIKRTHQRTHPLG